MEYVPTDRNRGPPDTVAMMVELHEVGTCHCGLLSPLLAVRHRLALRHYGVRPATVAAPRVARNGRRASIAHDAPVV